MSDTEEAGSQVWNPAVRPCSGNASDENDFGTEGEAWGAEDDILDSATMAGLRAEGLIEAEDTGCPRCASNDGENDAVDMALELDVLQEEGGEEEEADDDGAASAAATVAGQATPARASSTPKIKKKKKSKARVAINLVSLCRTNPLP